MHVLFHSGSDEKTCFWRAKCGRTSAQKNTLRSYLSIMGSWLDGLMFRISDSRLEVRGSISDHDTARSFNHQSSRSTQPCIPRVAKSNTSFGWGKCGKVTTILCDPIWHMITGSGVVISITSC